jgi:hypothetical protein
MRDKPPFRADHVGSLLRPPELLQAREDFAAGRIDADRLREVEDEAIRDVVAMQREVGLQSATDDDACHGCLARAGVAGEHEVPGHRRHGQALLSPKLLDLRQIR